MGALADRVIVVTGASRGIGRGMAIALAQEGAKIVVASRSQSGVDDTVRTIEAGEGRALGVTVDVGDRAAVFGMIDKTIAAFGRLDVLFNNAQGFGTEKSPAAAPVIQPLEEFDEDEWEYTHRTGLSATLWAMKAAFPHMREKGGKIINFGSEFGMIGQAGSAAYNSTKEAIRALSRTAAREWGKYGITVNVVSPMVRTDALEAFEKADREGMEFVREQIPLRRFGDPLKDAGGLARFLASDDSSYLTGMNFMLDGGHFMAP